MNKTQNSLFLFIKEVRTYLGTRDAVLLSGAGISCAVAFLATLFFMPLAGILFVALLLSTAACFVLLLYLRTARSRFEHEIKNTELEAVVDVMRDGVIVYDVNFRIMSINRAAEAIFGVSSEEVAGVYVTPDLVKNPHLRTLTQTIFPSLAPSMHTLSGDGWPQIVDITFDEPKLELHTVMSKVTGQDGRVVGFLKLVTDITRERAIVRSKNDFIAVAAHQLRTPMTALNWIFESLEKSVGEKKEDAVLRTSIREGHGLVQRSLTIVNDLLDAAQIEEGRFGAAPQEIDVAQFLESVITDMKPYAEEHGVSVRFLTPNEHYRVITDPERLAISVNNFLDNAVKYNTRNGSVTVKTELSGDQRFVVVRISDTGIGIPREDMEKLSQKFYRGAEAIRLEPNGSGLGVYIAKNIIEGLGGTIRIESETGRGTVITFTIPLKRGV